jgi:hypothetical protein
LAQLSLVDPAEAVALLPADHVVELAAGDLQLAQRVVTQWHVADDVVANRGSTHDAGSNWCTT